MNNKFNRRAVLFGLGSMLSVFAESILNRSQAQSVKAPSQVTIAYQPGIGYANLLIVKQLDILERRFPNTKFEWKVLASGAAIRDGMLAGQIQFGSGGVAPFLVGWDRGVGWKILSSLNHQDLWLVARDPNIKTIKDIKPNMKIGLPAPDSIQAVTLRRAAQRELGNANALDTNLLAISHPLGFQALLSGQIAAHLTAPHFQFQAVEQGARVLLKSSEVFGTSSAGSVFVLEKFYNEYPEFNQGIYNAIADATKILNANPRVAARYVSDEGEGKISADQFRTWITHPAVKYSNVPRGFLKYGAFMNEIKMLNKAPQSIQELVLPPLRNVKGD